MSSWKYEQLFQICCLAILAFAVLIQSRDLYWSIPPSFCEPFLGHSKKSLILSKQAEQSYYWQELIKHLTYLQYIPKSKGQITTWFIHRKGTSHTRTKLKYNNKSAVKISSVRIYYYNDTKKQQKVN